MCRFYIPFLKFVPATLIWNDKATIMTENNTVFISYAREDSDAAKRLYNDLKNAHLNPWLDVESILPGENWDAAIKKAIKNSRYFMALLSSNSVTKTGYVQKELKNALEEQDKLPELGVYIIPIRLDNCEMPYEKLEKIHYADFFPDWNKGLKRILQVMSKENQKQQQVLVQVDKIKSKVKDPLFKREQEIYSYSLTKILNSILQYPNRNKIELCDGLTVTNLCIGLWYNKIEEKYAHARHNPKQRYTFNMFKDIIWQKDIQPQALRCRTFLEYARSKLEDPREKKLRKLRDKLDIEKIKQIIRNIDEFFAKVSGSDVEIYEKLMLNPDRVSSDEIYLFIANLLIDINTIRDKINLLTVQLKLDLDCPARIIK
jgi:hypothetical protein